MKLNFLRLTFLICIISVHTSAHLCQVQSPTQYSAPVGFDLYGIGDGCTLSGTFGGVHYDLSHLSGFKRRQAERFRDTFTQSCNRHDKCLTEIGQAAIACHNEFHSRMRQACDSAFKWYQYVDRELCRQTARGYYDAVVRFTGERTARYLQSATLVRARELESRVIADQCGSSVRHSNLFAADVEVDIQNTFRAVLGREATPYEQLKIATDESLIFHRESWRTRLYDFAVSLKNAPRPPSIRIAANSMFGLDFTIHTDLPVIFTNSRINGRQTTETRFQVFESPMYDSNVNVRGTILAVGQNGAKNILLVDQQYRLRGSCASHRRQQCY